MCLGLKRAGMNIILANEIDKMSHVPQGGSIMDVPDGLRPKG